MEEVTHDYRSLHSIQHYIFYHIYHLIHIFHASLFTIFFAADCQIKHIEKGIVNWQMCRESHKLKSISLNRLAPSFQMISIRVVKTRHCTYNRYGQGAENVQHR